MVRRFGDTNPMTMLTFGTGPRCITKSQAISQVKQVGLKTGLKSLGVYCRGELRK